MSDEVKCNDVDGNGRGCVLAEGGWCNITSKLTRNAACHCPDARREALLAQLTQQDHEVMEVGRLVMDMEPGGALLRCEHFQSAWKRYRVGAGYTPARVSALDALRAAAGEAGDTEKSNDRP